MRRCLPACVGAFLLCLPIVSHARPGVVDRNLSFDGLFVDGTPSPEPLAYLDLPDGFQLVIANSSVAGKEGILVRCDLSGRAVSTYFVDGRITSAQADPQGNVILIQNLPPPKGESESQLHLTKVAPDGHKLWRLRLVGASMPQLSAVDALGNVWLTDKNLLSPVPTLASLTHVTASGQIDWAGSYSNGSGPSQFESRVLGLAVDRLGNAVLAQAETYTRQGPSTNEVGIYRIDPAGRVVWSAREDLLQFAFDTAAPSPGYTPALSQFSLGFDSLNRVVGAGSGYFASPSPAFGNSTPRMFLFAYDSAGQRRWVHRTQDDSWEQDPVVVVDSTDRVVVSMASFNQLIATTFSAEGQVIWSSRFPFKLGNGGFSTISPLSMVVDEQGGPLIYLDATFQTGREVHFQEKQLMKLTSAGALAWSLVVTNIAAVDRGTLNYVPPLVILRNNGEVRTLGNPQTGFDSPLKLDLGQVRPNGTPGRYRQIEVQVPPSAEVAYDFAANGEGSVWVGSLIGPLTDGSYTSRLIKVRPDGSKGWESSWTIPSAPAVDDSRAVFVSNSGYSALSFVYSDEGLVVRVLDPEGTVLWTRTTGATKLLGIGSDGAVWLEKISGPVGSQRILLQKLGTDGVPIWTRDRDTSDHFERMRIYEGIAGQQLAVWLDPDRSVTRLQELSPTGLAGWSRDLSLRNAVVVREENGTFHITGATNAETDGQVPSIITVSVDTTGQVVSSNSIALPSSGSTQVWADASGRNQLLRVRAGSVATSSAIFYISDAAVASRLLGQGICIPYQDDRQTSASAVASAYSLTGIAGNTLGPIFTSLNEAYVVRGWALQSHVSWNLLRINLRDGVVVSPEAAAVFGSGNPLSYYTLMRTTDLSKPWQRVKSLISDAHGDLLYTETTLSSGSAFYRFVPQSPE